MSSFIPALPARHKKRVGAALAAGGVVLMGTSFGLTDASSPVNAGASLTALPPGPIAGIQGYHLAVAPTNGALTSPQVRLRLPVGEQVFAPAEVPGEYSSAPHLPVLPDFCGVGSQLGAVVDKQQEIVCTLPDVKDGATAAYEFFTGATPGRTGVGAVTAVLSAGSIQTVHTDTTGKSWVFNEQGKREPLRIHAKAPSEVSGSLVGTAWVDSSEDGRFDTDEAPLAGADATIRPLAPQPGAKTEYRVTTNAKGEFTKAGLVPGPYVVSFAVPEGFSPNTQTSFEVTVEQSDPVTVSAGFVTQRGTASGSVWNDSDANGVRDLEDGPIGGIAVELSGTDQTGAAVTRSTTSAPDGGYEFDDVPFGDYQVSVTPAEDAEMVSGKDSFGASKTFALTAEQRTVTDLDTASTERVAQLRGRIQSAGHGDVAKLPVLVTGTDAYGKVSIKTHSDAAGNYSVPHLLPGDYQVQIGEAAPESVTLTAAAPIAQVASEVTSSGATKSVVTGGTDTQAPTKAAAKTASDSLGRPAAVSSPTVWLLVPIAAMILAAGFFAQWRLQNRRQQLGSDN